jgi:hypothetical protein
METIITGIFAVEGDAEEAMLELMRAGVATDDLSYIVLNAEEEVIDEMIAEGTATDGKEGKLARSIGAGVVTGGGAGALAGLAIVLGTAGGLGPVVAAGPIATALGLTGAAATTLTGATAGAVIGGLVGVLSGMGIAREDAETYEERVRAGDVLVLVSVTHETEISPVENILINHNAEEVRSYKTNGA